MLEQDPGERVPRAERAGAEPAQATPAPSAGVDPEWLDAQLSRLDLLLRALVEPAALARLLLVELAPLVGAVGGAVYTVLTSQAAGEGATGQLTLCATHGIYRSAPASVTMGQGLVGQCAAEQRKLIVRDVPAEHFRLRSAPASARARHCVLVPVWIGEASLALLELAFHEEPSAAADALLDVLVERRARAVSRGEAANGSDGSRLRPSYRYGFWGKLSHELRSPLNSVLVLSQLLSENAEENLTDKQVAFAKAIHSSGSDLLALVNAISDLSKIETNRLILEPIEMSFQHLEAHLRRAFEPAATERGLELSIELGPGLPDLIVTDAKRVRQILNCLLSNAFKFTESGRVSVSVTLSRAGWSCDNERLNNAREVVAFAVTDTGVGLSESEQRSILEVFPPERIEARRGPGASGLGLAISRELARLLGGDLRVTSEVGTGSTFTLYLPVSAVPLVASEHPPVASPLAPAAATPESGWVCGTSSSHGRGPQTVPSSAARSSAAAPASPSLELFGLDVLLVDDDVRSAFALTGILERLGAGVSHAEGLAEALHRLAEGRRASVLLIDADVLGSEPEDLVRRMLQRCEQLPIIALTGPVCGEGASSRPTRDRHLAVPPQVHQLTRPVEPAELVRLLRTVAARARNH